MLYPEMLIFTEKESKNYISKIIWKNVVFIDMLIFSDICAKNDVQKTTFEGDLKLTFFSLVYWFFQNDLKKRVLPQYVDIYADKNKTRLFQEKNVVFVDIFGYTVKKRFLKLNSKQFTLPLNVDIYEYVDMGYSELGGHSKTLRCCAGAWKYEGWETVVYTEDIKEIIDEFAWLIKYEYFN